MNGARKLVKNSAIKMVAVSMLLAMVGCSEPVSISSISEFETLSAKQQVQACNTQELSARESTPFVDFDLAEPLPANSGLSDLIGNANKRKSVSLNGEWQYLIDQLDMGDKGITMQGGVGLGHAALPTELLEYAFSEDHTLIVPGDWNSQVPSLEWYRGVIWYKKIFTINFRCYIWLYHSNNFISWRTKRNI